MKYLKIFGIFLLFTIILTGVYFAIQFNKIDHMFDTEEREKFVPVVEEKIDEKTGEISFLNYEFKDKDKRPFTVLLLGTDSNNLKYGRTDTIVLAVVDPKDKKIRLLSFPRDTRMKIAGTEKIDKVNHAYNNGISTTIATIENYLNIPIDYYMTINLKGFVDLVNEFGGIEVDVEKNMSFHDRLSGSNFSLNKGVQTLNGRQALNYARYRSDGEGDFGRNRRQRQVITSMIDQSIDFRNVTKITDIFTILGENARTDLSLNQTLKMAIQLSGVTGSNVESIKMEAYPVSYGGISYVEVSEKEHERIKELLKNILLEKELETE